MTDGRARRGRVVGAMWHRTYLGIGIWLGEERPEVVHVWERGLDPRREAGGCGGFRIGLLFPLPPAIRTPAAGKPKEKEKGRLEASGDDDAAGDCAVLGISRDKEACIYYLAQAI